MYSNTQHSPLTRTLSYLPLTSAIHALFRLRDLRTVLVVAPPPPLLLLFHVLAPLWREQFYRRISKRHLDPVAIYGMPGQCLDKSGTCTSPSSLFHSLTLAATLPLCVSIPYEHLLSEYSMRRKKRAAGGT